MISPKPNTIKILVIDDDRELNGLLTDYLSQFDFEVIWAAEPMSGLRRFKEDRPDLVILDIMLPERSGFELCKEIRLQSQIPIIILTARGDVGDRVKGFELGADDYVPKPYEPRELVARIQSVLRRVRSPEPQKVLTFLVSSDLRVDLSRDCASLAGVPLDLTQTELEILKFLMKNYQSTVTRDQITDHLRGSKCDAFDRTVDVLISRVRHKLGDSPRKPKYLKTTWGSGYRFIGTVSELTAEVMPENLPNTSTDILTGTL